MHLEVITKYGQVCYKTRFSTILNQLPEDVTYMYFNILLLFPEVEFETSIIQAPPNLYF